MKKEALIEFVKTNDFAYVYGAGIALLMMKNQEKVLHQ